MNDMNDIFPKPAAEPKWNAARSRLEDYLRAWHITEEVQRERIILRVLERAAGKSAGHPEQCPTALVMEEFRADLELWLKQNLASRGRPAVTGALAWFALDEPQEWATAFLAEELPGSFQRSLREGQAHVRATPALRVSRMVPQPFASPLRSAIDLPAPWDKLAQELAPLLSKTAAAALSSLSGLSGVRLW